MLHEFIAENREESASAFSPRPMRRLWLFRAFEQRHADRTGLGLGLAFSRWGTEVNDGRISAHNLPGRGCVFTIDLPRVPASVHALVGRSGFPVSSHMTVLAASDRTSG